MAARDIDTSDRSELLDGSGRPIFSFVPRRYRPGNLGNWSGHLPFANDLIASHRPDILVELGTHFGESYFGFCQAVLENGLPTTCYAVDHWLGEAHSGQYGHDVYDEVYRYNELHYKSFSYLLRTSFDEALSSFSDESIGLLHIDGLHTYEAGLHDFEAWLPKVTPGGIILLHDIAARHADFGIWRLWEMLEKDFESFAFHHSWGLGVIRKAGPKLPDNSFLSRLFRSSGHDAERIRRYYVLGATFLEHSLSPAHSGNKGKASDFVQIFPFGEHGYSEETATRREVGMKSCQVVSASFPDGLGNGPLRIDPCECEGLIQIRRLTISAGDSQVLWDTQDAEAIERCRVSGPIRALEGLAPATFVSFGSDPQIYFAAIPEAARFNPVTVSIEIAIGHSISDFAQMFPEKGDLATHARAEQIKSLEVEVQRLTNEHAAAQARTAESESAVLGLRQQLDQRTEHVLCLQLEIEGLRRNLADLRALARDNGQKLKAAQKESSELRERADALAPQLEALSSLQRERQQILNDRQILETENGSLKRQLSGLQSDIEAVRHGFASEQCRRIALEHSLSWAVTKPLRAIWDVLFVRRTG